MKLRRVIAAIMSIAVLGFVSFMLLTITHFITMERIEAREAAELDARLSAALPEGETFTELTDIELVEGVTHVYAAENGAGVVITLNATAITDEHSVTIALTPEGRVISAVLDPESPGAARLITEDVLNAFTKVMGNYNTGYSTDVLSNSVVMARDQLELLDLSAYQDQQGGDQSDGS